MAEILKDRGFCFWDIESLSNIFTIAFYTPKEYTKSGKFDVLLAYLLDDAERIPETIEEKIGRYVMSENQLDPNETVVKFANMKDEKFNLQIAKLFSLNSRQIFKTKETNMYSSIVDEPTTDLFDNDEPYYVGFNTNNYDLTMMAQYFTEIWGLPAYSSDLTYMQTSAKTMRDFNDMLFAYYRDQMNKAVKGKEPTESILRNMQKSGKFIDACKVNDKLGKIALKRIEAMLGLRITEFNGLNSQGKITPDKLPALFAYNLSDCIKLSKAFTHDAFQSSFNVKKSIINSYNDIVFDKNNDVREFRSTINDSSAQLVAALLCPDGHLKDRVAVSTDYMGRNILQEQTDWAKKNLTPEAFEMVNKIFDYYRSFEGKNFNSSNNYVDDWSIDALPVYEVADIPFPQTTIPYFNKDGSWNGCYVNFSIGGIHGAEYAALKYEQDLKAYEDAYANVKAFIDHFTPEELEKLKGTVEIDGEKYKVSSYITHKKDGTLAIKWPKKPELFVTTSTGNWQLNKAYTYCSNIECDHDDFTSYYPSLLMNLKAYENPMLGEDRYVQQFDNKTLYGKYMKDKNRSEAERNYYKVARGGTKLILNSASGASDTAYDNHIRMNNMIISMRIIGQLFTWRIGQAMSLEGFPVPSTNTDGLYVKCDATNREKCRQILDREAAEIQVGIEPEEMRLISKDANNRIELSLDRKILGTSGGDVACYDGIDITKSIAHPALIDHLLTDYLNAYGCNEDFDYDRAITILDKFKAETPIHHQLSMYQMILNSSVGSNRFVFAEINGEARALQHNNRAYIIKRPGAHVYIANGVADLTKEYNHDPTADKILTANGVDPEDFKVTKIIKVTKLDPEKNVFIYNDDITENGCSEKFAKELIANCDDGFYLELLENAYKNWHNEVPNAYETV